MSVRHRLTGLQKLKSLAVVGTTSIGFFVGINVYKQNEKFYDNILMPLVHFLPPETSHRLAVLACKFNLFGKQTFSDPISLKTKFLNYDLSNPIGIAAGFDKHAEAINGLNNIGFGFVEIGSVTPKPQEGNEKPRVFRLIKDKAVINRYGFNSDGFNIVYDRINVWRKDNTTNGILGVNLGKNKESESAENDYVDGVLKFGEIADYLVINISSPNTPGLRSLQTASNDLKSLLAKVLSTRNTLTKRVPIILKLAPDLSDNELKDIAKIIERKECSVDGLIISNTTIVRPDWLESPNAQESGGLSGAPLTDRSTEMIGKMYQLTNGKIPIIGVGGVFTGQQAYEKLLAGASVIQLYTSFTYHGPPIIVKIKKELVEILAKNGYDNVQQVIGKSVVK